MGMEININFEEERWLDINLKEMAEKACKATLSSSAFSDILKNTEISILACNDNSIRVLNERFRGTNAPTNILSWPRGKQPNFSEMRSHRGTKCKSDVHDLGDIAISYDTCLNQSYQLDLKLEDHVMHLLVHACLHLLGFSHKEDSDFQKMKLMEIKCLAECGIKNPYTL